MCSIPNTRLPLSRGTDFDFEGGDTASDGGVLPASGFCEAIGPGEALREHLESHPLRTYDDCDVAYQRVIMLTAGYLRDSDSGRLRLDPAFDHVLGGVASQPTVSRRPSGMGEGDVGLLRAAIGQVGRAVAQAAPDRRQVVIDVDSTPPDTFGKQEGPDSDHHYQARGYHPLVATDTLRRECVDLELRGGTAWCSKGSGPFLGRVLDEAAAREPRARIAVRGDSGFAAPEVYEACERRGVTYAIRLKLNRTILARAFALLHGTFEPGVPRTVTREFRYRAGSWDRERRVVVEARQEEGRPFPELTFVVADPEAMSSLVTGSCRGRGETGRLVGEPEGFARGCVCSAAMAANEFRCLLAMLAHCVLSWMRELCLGEAHQSDEPRTVVWEFVRVGAKRVTHGRRTCFHFSSAYARRDEFFRAVVACDAVHRRLRAA